MKKSYLLGCSNRLRVLFSMAALVTAACGSGDHSHIVTGVSGAGGEATEAGTGATPNGGSTGQIGEAGATSETCSGGSVAPVWPAGATLTATASVGAVSLSWPSATGADRYKVFVDGGEVATVSGLTFLAPLAPGASHTLRVDAGELCGKTATGPAATATASLPPDPATIAPPLPIAALTPFPSAVSFLYTGPNPIQTGMKTGALDDTRVSVVRGKVTACDGTPIPGVKVSVPSAPDLGWTFSRADGQFDMAVNGGCCEVGVQYAAAGYPTVQRKVTTPMHEYVNAPDVALVPYDSSVTTVTLPATGAVSAQGSQVKDSAGTRHATVIFPPGVTASMTLPDGTEAPLPTLHVRATEYTSDACGLAAMPGNLPAESAYTYAAELSADEAVQANATAVNFSQPVALYVDNFLNFPNGAAVPTGYYNRTTQCWQPVPNGVVVTLTSVAGGSAAIDVNGDGVADDTATLGALGITPEETQELAKIYAAGVTLWRSPLPHFSPWDDNWPQHQNAVGAPPTVTPELHIPVAPQPCENGSDIGCLSSSLGESIPIAGVGTALSYSTKWLTPVHLDVPVTPSIGVGALDTALVAVDVAGRHFEQTYQPLPSQTYHFDWDGKDAYGRVVIGSTPIRVKVTYFFPAQYVPAGSAFGAYGTTTTEGDVSWTVNARGDDAFSTQWSGTVSARSPTSAAIGGGWQTSDYLQFDPTNNAIYSGKGDVRKIQQTAHAGQSLTIETIAGTGTSGSSGDEGPATQAQFKYPRGLALGPDGSLYISDADDNRVRKITPDGIIHAVAGTGNQGSGPDEGNALETDLQRPQSLAVDCEGNLYIGDDGDDKFRKLTPDGKLHAVPFRQMDYFEGLDGPAASASLVASESAPGIAERRAVLKSRTSNHQVEVCL